MPRAKKEELKEEIKEGAKESKTSKPVRSARKVKEASAKTIQPDQQEKLPEKETSSRKKSDKYFEALGRRKTAVARVRLFTKGGKEFIVNGKPFEQYFSKKEFALIVEAPLVKMNCDDRFKVTVVVKGGGINSQAQAIRHGISRALVLFNPDFKKRLKKSGYLTRDPRMKERKKPGLKGARRAPQWAKR